jgi:hypothetical protein
LLRIYRLHLPRQKHRRIDGRGGAAAESSFPPFTFCEVGWPLRRTYPTLFVSASAVANNLERTFVIRIRNNRAEWVNVETGVTNGNVTEIFGDLHEGDEVATHGSDQLRSGTEVSPHPVASK